MVANFRLGDEKSKLSFIILFYQIGTTKWTSIGILGQEGESYYKELDIPSDLYFGFPCSWDAIASKWKVVQNLATSDEMRKLIDAALHELSEERIDAEATASSVV